jgi:uncharacterized membrane protein
VTDHHESGGSSADGGARRDQHGGHVDAAPVDRTEPAGRAMTALIESPERILTLTDGVVAIAMTLLVLDLTAIDYQGSSAGDLWRILDQESGRFVSFFITFWVIAQFWLGHRRVLRRVTHHEDALATRNFWFLFGISILPFSARLLGQTNDNPLPVALFSANLLLLSLSLSWLSRAAIRSGAVEPLMSRRQLLMNRTRTVATTIMLVLPGALAWVIRPGTAELLFLLLVLPDLPARLVTWRAAVAARR